METNFSNLTNGGQVESRSQTTTAITNTLYIVMGLLGVFGNGLVLLVIVVVRDLHDVTNVLIGNQSLIDLLTSLLLLASFAAPLPPLPINNPTLARFICAFWHSKFPLMSMLVASSLNLTLMTLERYYAIVFPLHYHSRTKSARFICLVALPWLSGLAYQQHFMWFTRVEQGQCLVLQEPNDATRTGFAFGAAFLELVLPLAVMVFVYTSISIKLKSTVEEKFNKRTRKNRGTETSVSQTRETRLVDHRSRARRNVLKVMVTVSVFFITCWVPNKIIVFAYCFGYDLDFNGLISMFCMLFAFANMWVNPFIYSFQYRRFQKGLRKVFCRWVKDTKSKKTTGVFKNSF